ncbi:MAG: formate dehydrogenase accessory protein FdhE [Acidilobaceae archaeon]
MSLIRAVCGQDEHCFIELWGFMESLAELDRKLGEVRVEGSLGAAAPVIIGVPEETISEMSDKLYRALRELGYDIEKESVDRGARGAYEPEDQASSFASFAFKRLLYKTARGAEHQALSQPWSETYCPVCGLLPVAVVDERDESGFPQARYKCLCGNSWRQSEFMCPSCKARGGENFEVHHVGRLPMYLCKNCGHMMLVASSEHISGAEDEEILPIIAAIAANTILQELSQESGEEGGDEREDVRIE